MKKKLTQSCFFKIIIIMIFLCSTKASALFGVTTYTTSDTEINVNWKPNIFPANVASYSVFHYDRDHPGGTYGNPWIYDGNTGGTSFQIKNLMAGHCYYVRVVCNLNTGNDPLISEFLSAICTSTQSTQTLGGPFNVILNTINSKTAYVSFSFNFPSAGIGIVGFKAFYRVRGSNSGFTEGPNWFINYPDVLGDGTIYNLTPNTEYELFIQEEVKFPYVEDHCDSCYFNSATVYFITDPLCFAPKKFKKMSGTPSSISFEWDDNTPGPYKFRRCIVNADGTKGSWVTVTNIAETAYNATGLTSGNTYDFQVGITCSGINGSVTDIWTAPITIRVIPPPATPTNLNVLSVDTGYTKAMASWTTSKDANKYEILVKPTSSSTWPLIGAAGDHIIQAEVDGGGGINIISGSTSTSGIIHGLLPNETYDYKIRAINSDGYSSTSFALPSTNLTIKTLTTILPVPNTPDVNCQEALVSWSHVQTEMFDYTRYRVKGTTLWTPFTQIDITNATAYADFTELTAATQYEWQVQGSWQATATTTNIYGETINPILGDQYVDGFKNGVDFTTPPQCTDLFTDSALSVSPINLEIQLKNEINNYAVFSWINGAGTTPKSYELRYKPKNGIAWTLLRITDLSTTTPALLTGESYEWQIRSVTDVDGITYKSPYVIGNEFNTGAFKMNSATVTTATQVSILLTATTAVNNVGADTADHFELRLKDNLGTIIRQWTPQQPTLDTALTSHSFSGSIDGLSAATIYGADIRIVSKSGTASVWIPVYDLQSGLPNDPFIRTMCILCDSNFDAGNTRSTASIFNPFTKNLHDRIQNDTDVDWYKIEIPIGTLSFEILFSQSYSDIASNYTSCYFTNKGGRDYDLYLYNSAGTLLQSSTEVTYAFNDRKVLLWRNAGKVWRNYSSATTGIKTYYIKMQKKSSSLSDARECYILNYAGQSKTTARYIKPKEKPSKIADEIISGIKLVPNPATSSFTAYFNANDVGQATLSILNISGQMIHNEEITTSKGTNDKEINISQLANGIYLVKVQTDAGANTAKLIINH